MFVKVCFCFIWQKTLKPVWAIRSLHKSAVEGILFLFVSFLFFSFPSTAEHLCSPPTVLKRPDPVDTVTASYGRFISDVKPEHLSSVVLQRSKRMILDSMGVGLIGSTTDVFALALQHCQVRLCKKTNTSKGFYFMSTESSLVVRR